MQDFFGVIEQMRLWRVVRTPEEIMAGMDADDGRGAGKENSLSLAVSRPGNAG